MSNNAVVPLRSGGKIAGIVPESVEEVFRLAQAVAKSGLAPRGMDTPEKLTVAIMTGMEIGLPPMFAINKIAVVNGRPTIWGDAIPALIWGAGMKLREWMTGEGDERVAHCEVKRPNGEATERTFSVADAKKAGLWGKAGPWQQYPERMLQMRARGFAARDGAADVLGGLYLEGETEREAIDITPRRTAHAVRKSGDYERFEADIRAQTTVEDIDNAMERWRSLLATMPEGHEANAAAFAEARKLIVCQQVDIEETIADASGLVEKLREEMALADSPETRAEVAEQYADIIERLPGDFKSEALKIIEASA